MAIVLLLIILDSFAPMGSVKQMFTPEMETAEFTIVVTGITW